MYYDFEFVPLDCFNPL